MSATETQTVYLMAFGRWAQLLQEWYDDEEDIDLTRWNGLKPFRPIRRLPNCPACESPTETVTGGNPHPMDGAPGVATFQPCGHQIDVRPENERVPDWRDERIGCDWDDGRHVADRYERPDGSTYTTVPEPVDEDGVFGWSGHYPGWRA